MSWASETLTKVQTAITNLVENPVVDVMVNGRRYVFADLEKLYAMEQQLSARVAAETRGSRRNLVKFG